MTIARQENIDAYWQKKKKNIDAHRSRSLYDLNNHSESGVCTNFCDRFKVVKRIMYLH